MQIFHAAVPTVQLAAVCNHFLHEDCQVSEKRVLSTQRCFGSVHSMFFPHSLSRDCKFEGKNPETAIVNAVFISPSDKEHISKLREILQV
jgi:hypothetical protein